MKINQQNQLFSSVFANCHELGATADFKRHGFGLLGAIDSDQCTQKVVIVVIFYLPKLSVFYVSNFFGPYRSHPYSPIYISSAVLRKCRFFCSWIILTSFACTSISRTLRLTMRTEVDCDVTVASVVLAEAR